jgi:hypothetical protein
MDVIVSVLMVVVVPVMVIVIMAVTMIMSVIVAVIVIMSMVMAVIVIMRVTVRVRMGVLVAERRRLLRSWLARRCRLRLRVSLGFGAAVRLPSRRRGLARLRWAPLRRLLGAAGRALGGFGLGLGGFGPLLCGTRLHGGAHTPGPTRRLSSLRSTVDSGGGQARGGELPHRFVGRALPGGAVRVRTWARRRRAPACRTGTRE